VTDRPRVFVVDYHFLACGDVFTRGLLHAAEDLGLVYGHAESRSQNLVHELKAFHPDFVFVVHGRLATPKLNGQTRGIPKAVWLLDEPYEVDNTRTFSAAYDHVFVNDASTLPRHRASCYLPVCYDSHVHRDPGRPRPYAVGFIGGGNTIRNRYLDLLAQAGLLSYVVGGEWASPRVRNLTIARNIPASVTADYYQQTRIVLNVFREKHHFNRERIPATSMNPRIYEALACGAMVVSEWRPEIEDVLPDLPTFRSDRECLDIITDLLANPDRMEERRQSSLARIRPHTYTTRLRTVLAVANMGAEVNA